MDIQTVIFMELFPFINFTFVTRKWENTNATNKLATQSEIFYFFNLVLVLESEKIKV